MRAMRLVAIGIFVSLFPSVAACSDDSALQKGRQIAEEHCVSCHSIDQTGDSALVEAPPFRTLGQTYDVRFLQEALAEGIVTGHEGMPEFRLEPEEIEDFLDYLASIQKSR